MRSALPPTRSGSYSQFYIVDNNTPQDINSVITTITEQLADESISSRLLPEDLEYYNNYLKSLKKIPAEVSEKYLSAGGLYQLDGTQTVFGQVIDGYDVLEAITASEVVTGNEIDDLNGVSSKPINSIVIETVEIIKIEPAVEEESTKKTTAKKTTTDTQIAAESLGTTTPETTPETTTKAPLDTLISLD